MNKQAICIQCHNKAEQINYLISCFPEDKFDFYIHVDKKSDIFAKITRKENVYFADRIDVRWGQFSQVEATLSIFKMIDVDKYCYVHLISGNDFIVKKPEEFIEFFGNSDREFIDSNILPGTCTWSWHGEDRYSVYYPQWIIQRPAHTIFKIMRVAYREFVMRTKIFKRKNCPVPIFYGGSQWFSITSGCLLWILKYLREHPEYVDFFRHGVCVDEVFFSTLIRYSPYVEKIANNNLRFMKWQGGTSGGPDTLTKDDFDNMLMSECFWARKFVDYETITELYKTLSYK